jgi:squalene-associated FAD-dependent desaturase
VGQRVVIIGAGFAGLSAAVWLADAGFTVVVLEKRGHLGGRAYSFQDPTTGDVVDNGQHLFMGCYESTIAFLKKIECLDRLKFQPAPRVDFLDVEGHPSTFACPNLPAPLHALAGLLRMRGLNLSEKLRTLNVGRAIRRRENGAGDRFTVAQWLDQLGQSERIKRRFWYPMMIATLNEDPELASAKMMKAVLREAFGSGFSGSRIGIARVGLSDLYTDGARRYIESFGGRVRTTAEVSRIELAGEVVPHLELKSGETINADYFVSAIPPAPLARVLPEPLRSGELASAALLESSPIVSINLWFDEPVMDREFVGLLGTRCQWAFNKNLILERRSGSNQVAVVISAARDYVDWPREELTEMALADLRSVMPKAGTARLVHSTIVKERDATLSHTVESDRLRPDAKTSVRNFVLAGDWIDTGLPATIESAVLSGRNAANLIIKSAREAEGRGQVQA